MTIGIFISPGDLPPKEPGGKPVSNRSFEYDTPDGPYGRFLLEEILPEVAKKYKLDRQARGPRHLRDQQRAASAPSPWPGSGPTPSEGRQPHRQLHQHPRRLRLSRRSSARPR